MVDVGAHIGESFKPYVDLGWTIFAFEPDPNPKKLKSTRRRLPKNSKFFDIALSNSSADAMPFYSSEESSGISTLYPFLPSHKLTREVKTETLENIIKKEAIRSIELLKVDAEGHDLMVLKGLAWAVRPTIILCEFEDRKTMQSGYDYRQMGNYLLEGGYYVFLFEWFPIVRYGNEHQWRCLKQFPCELEDNNAWGNFIALRPDLKPVFLSTLKRANIETTRC